MTSTIMTIIKVDAISIPSTLSPFWYQKQRTINPKNFIHSTSFTNSNKIVQEESKKGVEEKRKEKKQKFKKKEGYIQSITQKKIHLIIFYGKIIYKKKDYEEIFIIIFSTNQSKKCSLFKYNFTYYIINIFFE